MKSFIAIVFALLAMIVLPTIVSAQPAPPPVYEYHCYYVAFPFPHSQCELRPIEYRLVPPPSHRRYVPGPRPGHHPPPPPRGDRDHRPPPNHGPRR